MSDQMPHDDELRELYRRLPADEPSAQVDAAILAAARARAVHESRSTLLGRIRWAVPLAAAAGVVLTFALMRLTPERPVAGLDESADVATARGESARPQAVEPQQGAAPAAPAEMAAAEREGIDEDEADAFAKREQAGDFAKREEAARAEARSNAQARERTARTRDGAAAPPKRDEVAGQEDETGRAAAGGSDAPSSAAPPAPSLAEPRAAAPAPSAAAPPPAASARRSVEALADGAAATQPPADEAAPATPSAAIDAMASKAVPETAIAGAAAVTDWPFSLRPSLDHEESCRRAAAALRVPCEFRGDEAVLVPAPGTKIDRGPHAGRTISRLALRLRDGKLQSIALRIAAATEDVVLTAPD